MFQNDEETRAGTGHQCHVQPYQQDRKLKQATSAPIQFSSTSSNFTQLKGATLLAFSIIFSIKGNKLAFIFLQTISLACLAITLVTYAPC